MKSVKSVSFKILLGLFATAGSLLLVSCGGGAFSSAAPGSENAARQALEALEASVAVPTTNAKVGYVFSDNYFGYQPCPGIDPCPENLVVGNPVHSYQFDAVSGMPTFRGMDFDSTPANTKSIAVSPSGRHLYLLAGDNLLYTYTIGYSIFSEAEFKEHNLDPLELFNALSQAGYLSGPVLSAADAVDRLNNLLEQPLLYDQILAQNLNLFEPVEIQKLKTDTVSLRTLSFGDLAEIDQKAVIRLNRLMVELAYPGLVPPNKGDRVKHAVGAPVASLPSSGDQHKVFASIEIDPAGRFLYVLGRLVIEGYHTDPVTGVSTPYGKQAVSVYLRDSATGLLALSGNQILDIGQLIFAPSGSIAYGSTNGSLSTFSVDRNTGLLTAVGAPFMFESWVLGDEHNSPATEPLWPWAISPVRNMATDSSGKYLFLVGSSGTPWSPPPYVACPSKFTYHQLGSFIYTFIIDADSGLLTQAGPPLDTTPHIMTSVSVDSKGRFVQLLNTHEYTPGTDPATGIPYGYKYNVGCYTEISTSALAQAAIYSYSVDQTSGKLNPAGSLQAGGAQMPTGSVLGGLNSVSLTGDVSGRFLYLLNGADMYVYNVDQANGALTAVGSPLTGATAIAMPGRSTTPIIWPWQCYSNGVLNGYCGFNDGGYRSHSLTWAGY